MNAIERIIFWSAVAGAGYVVYTTVNPGKYKPWNPPEPDYVEEPQEDGSIIYRDRKTGQAMVTRKPIAGVSPKKKRKKIRLFKKRSDSE